MRRPAATENTLERIESWRKQCPDLVLRSTFIVGFPGESEDEFEELLDFLERAQLDRVGCFKYSPVEGASANALPDPVDEDIKEQRYQRFMQKQQEISAQKLQRRVGQRCTVLIDEIADEGAVGRAASDAPDIDGLVFIDGATHLTPGAWVDVEIEEADEYDTWAHLV
ncbi:2-methylthioadenine synthetase [gamma proteobacterium HTCC5015]|nr:2-methylthioadenine synthetase [gamma proteobacterium HTCC5015]